MTLYMQFHAKLSWGPQPQGGKIVREAKMQRTTARSRCRHGNFPWRNMIGHTCQGAQVSGRASLQCSCGH